MTKFITYYNLCPIPEPNNFLGISPDKDDGNIITTLGKNIIIIIKITTQKQVRSWSVIDKLCSRVVYDRCSEKYVGVFANNFLRIWDLDTTNVNKCKKLKFQKTIAELVSNGENTYVLYFDGSCELLSTAIQTRKNHSDISAAEQMDLAANLSFTNISVKTLPNGQQMLCYFQRNLSNGEYHLVCLPLQEESAQPKHYNLKRNFDVQVAGAAVIDSDGTPMLLTIWSDQRIFLLNLGGDVSPDKSPGDFVSVLTQLKVDVPLSVLGISKHFVAIYGANQAQEGASLLLYNTQYQVTKAKQFFKVYFNFSKLWSVDDHVILAMGPNLSVVKYRVLEEVLSELVGTQVSNDYETISDEDCINEESQLEEALQYDSRTNNVSIQDEQLKKPKCEYEIADGLSVPYVDSKFFDKEINALKQLELHADVVLVNQPLDDIQIDLMSNYYDNGFQCMEIQTISRELEKAGCSEHEISEKLLVILMKAELMQDIGICLRRYTNISDKIISKTLGFLLKKYRLEKNNVVPEIPNTIKKDNGHMEVEFSLETEDVDYPNLDLLAANTQPSQSSSTEIKELLNILLACSFDAESIALYIRQDVKYKQVVLILQHLYYMLTDMKCQQEERPSLNATSVDFEMQIFKWFGVFLNTHFQKLALSKDIELIELLFKWHVLLQSYRREFFDLQQVAALLYNIVDCKNMSREKNYSKWYSIEEIVLY